MKRMATGAIALLVALVSVMVLTTTSAEAFKPTHCAVTLNGSASAPADWRYCTWTNVGLEGATITTGNLTWYYSEDVKKASTAVSTWVLTDNAADGDCAVFRVAWVAQPSDTPAPGNWELINHVCGNGNSTPRFEYDFGYGITPTPHDFGYYQLQVGFQDNGNDFGWTNIWQEPLLATAR
jgi:hypothetical protein